LRALEELLARYTQDPDFADVYVEGVTDRGLLGWYFVEIGRPDITAYEIETVHVPTSLVRELGVENNNRVRVIALTEFLQQQLGPGIEAMGVIDGDLDYALRQPEPSQFVLRTDFTSMEMYFFSGKAIRKFVGTCCPTLPATADDLIREMTPALKKLFLARLANRLLGWNLQRVALTRSCQFAKDPFRLEFDWADYVTRYLNKNGRMGYREAFERVLTEQERKCASLPLRRRIHGHDFVDLLASCCSHLRPRAGLSSADLLGAMLRSGASAPQLKSQRLFRELVKRAPKPS
jgi:hypothetical protein